MSWILRSMTACRAKSCKEIAFQPDALARLTRGRRHPGVGWLHARSAEVVAGAEGPHARPGTLEVDQAEVRAIVALPCADRSHVFKIFHRFV